MLLTIMGYALYFDAYEGLYLIGSEGGITPDDPVYVIVC